MKTAELKLATSVDRERLPETHCSAEYGSQPAPVGTSNGWRMRCTYFMGDLLAIVLAIGGTDLFGRLLSSLTGWSVLTTEIKVYGLLTLGLLVVAALQRSYAAFPPRPVRQFRGWLVGAGCVWATLVTVLIVFGEGTVAQYALLGLATAVAFLTAALTRALVRAAFGKSNWWGTRVIVVATDSLASKTYQDLLREPQWGLRPVGYIADRKLFDDPHWLGPISQLEGIARKAKVNRALMAVHPFDQAELSKLVSPANSQIRHWIILPALEGFPSLWLEQCEAARLPAVALTNRLANPSAVVLKRMLDIAITLALGVIVVPCCLVIAVLIKLTSRGNVFYEHERIGRNGRRFKAWKFRTMHSHADKFLEEYLEQHPELAEEWRTNHKLKKDPRVTRIGSLLRGTSLDEVPQLWNVLRGEMSLVGPRPIVAEEIEKYSGDFQFYCKVQPGITGLWQVSGRNNTTYSERVQLDVYYAQNWSVLFDLYILACTVKVVLLGEGAY